ncbi:MAG: DUF7507 domain-containing protein [Acidimicrobiia bacterium]
MYLRHPHRRAPMALLAATIVLGALVTIPAPAGADPGDLDLTFDGDGKVTTGLFQSGVIHDVAVQADGKVVVVGERSDDDDDGDANFTVVRYNQDGSLDDTFDGDSGTGNGIVTTDFGVAGGNDRAQAVVIQPGDGKIIVGGQASLGNPTFGDFALARYNPSDGSLDTNFDGDGRATTDFQTGSEEEIRDLALQSDGKIVAAGRTSLGSGDFAVARYLATGALDNTGPGAFDGDGKVNTNSALVGGDSGAAVAIGSDGKITVAGESFVFPTNQVTVVRYHTNGSLDNTFDGDGIRSGDLPVGPLSFHLSDAVAMRSDGTIAVAGRGEGEAAWVIVYNTNGTPNSGFDDDGILVDDTIGDRALAPVDLLAQGSDLLLAATGGHELNRNFVVQRREADGDLDLTAFGGDGMAEVDFGGNADASRALALHPDGRIVVAGTATVEVPSTFAVARLTTSGDLDETFGGDGRVTTTFSPASSETGVDVVVQPDGKILVAASFGDFESSDGAFLIARYLPDGSLDPAFGADGWTFADFGDRPARARALALQADGRIVVAGTAPVGFDSEDGIALARFEADGDLDPVFGEDGTGKRLHLPAGLSEASAEDVAIDADGRIVVAGTAQTGPDEDGDFLVARYEPDGDPNDTFDDFNDDNAVTLDISGGLDDEAFSVVIQPDGAIVAAGSAEVTEEVSFDFAVARFLATGVLDTAGFGAGDGYLTTDFGFTARRSRAFEVDLQGDGRIVAAGVTTSEEDDDFALARYETDGGLDDTFGGDGRVVTPVGGGDDIADGLVIQADGRIVAAGSAEDDVDDPNFALARYETDGDLDPDFGTGGLVTTTFSPSFATGLALQPDGRLVAAGEADEDESSDIALARYEGGPQPLTIDKSGPAVSTPGTVVPYQFTVTNNTATTLTVVSVIDTLLGALTVPATCATLDPAEACTFTATRTVLAGDPDQLENAVTAVYEDTTETAFTASDSHTIDLFQPSISVSITGDELSKVGDQVAYQVQITNTSSSDTPVLELDSIIDTVLGSTVPPIDLTPGLCDDLLPGDGCGFPVTRTVPADASDPMVNEVVATYHPSGFPGSTVVGSDTHPVNLFQPSVAVTKTGPATADVGDVVEYEVTIENTSSADSPDLVLDSISDSLLGPLTAPTVPAACDTLAFEDSCTFTVTRTVLETDADPLVNTVTVHYHPTGFPNDVTASGSHSVDLPFPSVTVDKTGPATAGEGDAVTYTVTIRNTSPAGSPDLILDSVTDSLLGPLTAPTVPAACSPLAVGASCSFPVTRMVLAGDPDPLLNTVTVHYHPDGQTRDVTASDSHSVDLVQPETNSITVGVVGGDPTFALTPPAVPPFTLDPGEAATFEDVPPGEYTLTMTALEPGLILDAMDCDPEETGFDLAARTITFTVDDTTDIACTYTVSQADPGYDDDPGDPDFDFEPPFEDDDPAPGTEVAGETDPATQPDGPQPAPQPDNPLAALPETAGAAADTTSEPAAPDTLPRTGTPAGGLTMLGSLLVAAGGLALKAGRRHRGTSAESFPPPVR